MYDYFKMNETLINLKKSDFKYSTPDVKNKNVISFISEELKNYFKDKNYGEDVKSYSIGVHCLNIPIGFEKFSKLPKPKYTKGKKIISIDGIPFEIERSIEYSIKLDYETFINRVSFP